MFSHVSYYIVDACTFTMKRASQVTNRVHIAWTQTGRHSIIKWCQPYHQYCGKGFHFLWKLESNMHL